MFEHVHKTHRWRGSKWHVFMTAKKKKRNHEEFRETSKKYMYWRNAYAKDEADKGSKENNYTEMHTFLDIS